MTQVQQIVDSLLPDVPLSRLRSSVRERLNELEARLGTSHFVFATILSAEMEQARRVEADPTIRELVGRPDVRSVEGAREQTTQVLSAHGSPMPFGVVITDARIMSVLHDYGTDPFRAFEELAEEHMLEPRTGGEDTETIEAEWYVAIAYVCTALSAWEASRRACEFF